MSRPRPFGGRVRSNLSGLKGADAVSRQVAHKVQRELRRLARLYGSSEQLLSYPEAQPILPWLEGTANAIGPMYRPKYEWRPMMEIDRLGSSVGGLPYVSAEYPWPRTVSARRREPMNPLVQLDLGEISDCTGIDVGRGLLQVWRSSTGNYGYPITRLRVIEPESINPEAEMKVYPRAHLGRISQEWSAKVKSKRRVDRFFGKDEDHIRKYLHNLAIKGLIWGQDVDELRLLDPWWAGGEGAGFGPWQITGWRRHGYSLPRENALESLTQVNVKGSEAAASQEDSENAYFESLDAVLKPVAEAERARLELEDRKIGCQDNLFGQPNYYSTSRPCVSDMPSKGWLPLFNLEGPFEDDWVDDVCNVYYRKQGGKYKYAHENDFGRII